MNTYHIVIKLKNGNILDFTLESNRDMREELKNVWENKVLNIADYFIKTDEILWIHIEGKEGEKIVE